MNFIPSRGKMYTKFPRLSSIICLIAAITCCLPANCLLQQLVLSSNQQQQQQVTDNVKENLLVPPTMVASSTATAMPSSIEPNGECGANHLCQNGGTCVEGPYNYTCACPPGFTGTYCNHDINECMKRPNVCQNGATCINKHGSYQCVCVNGWKGHDCSENVDDCSTAACGAGATCHDKVGHFYCECPPGKTGLLCQLEDGCYQNPCHSNATCDTSPIDGRATCTCPSGFTGEDCSIDNDECQAGSPCEHGGLCVNIPGSFMCKCPHGFTGSRCELNINECDNNPCRNDAQCLDEKGGYRCICPDGFTGVDCQIDIDDCAQNPCQNGANCTDHVHSFKCHCPAGFWGPKCECSPQGCVNNDVAWNVEFPQPVNLAPNNPWSRCSNPYACWLAFKNGKCDPECNTQFCLYDGNDCPHNDQPSIHPSPKCDENDNYCLKKYADNICHVECNRAECGWDGGDCMIPNNRDELMPASNLAQGLLIIRVQPAIELESNTESSKHYELAGILRQLSVYSKTILKIQNFRQVDDGTQIELIADNSRCRVACYNSTELIAKFLSALKEKTKVLERSSELRIKDISSSTGESTTDQRSQYALWVIVLGALTICCTLLMVVSVGGKQKVKEKAVVWFPEGFKPVLTSRNRDPTNRKPGRGVSTLQALGGNFFRGLKSNERNISNDPNGLHSTDVDRCATSTPNGGGIYHEPYDQYSTYNGTDSGSMANNVDEPMTPTPMSVNPINMEGPQGFTPLMVAAMGPVSKGPLGLLAYGTTGEMNGVVDNNVTDLLHRGAQVNLANKDTGETALHLAARHGRVDAARGLLERCDPQNVNAPDITGRTPLHAAIAADSLGVFELLMRHRGTDLNTQDQDGTTPLILATRVGTYSMIEELILNECEVTKADKYGKTALHWAAATNNVDAIRRLLAVRETNKDAQDLTEETPLFLAAREGAKGAVEILLNHNANKDISDLMERSPIEIARSRQHYDIVRLLEEHEPPTPRSINSLHHLSRQLSPFSPMVDSNSNSNSSTNPPPSYHAHSHSQSGRHGGRQAQKAALERSSSTKPLIAEANIIRNNLQNCKSVMIIKTEDKESHEINNGSREVKTLGRRATQSTSSSHQTIQHNMHMSQFGALSANNVVMPATPNSLTNSLSPASCSMMSPPTSSLHHLNSPTKSSPPMNINQLHRQHNTSSSNQVHPQSYDECQTFWTNNNNPNIVDKTLGLSEPYNVPCLKNYMTPSPESPFSMKSMASPPGAYNNQQAGVFI